MKKRSLLYSEFRPNVILSPFIKCYWSIKANSEMFPTPEHGVIPTGHTDLVFNLGEQILHNETGGVFVREKASFLVGPFDCFRRFRTEGEFEYLGVRFHAGAVPFSFHFPLTHARNRAVRFDSPVSNEAITEGIQMLARRLAQLACAWQRIECVERFLIRICREWKEPDPVVSSALKLIERSHGRIAVGILASLLGLSARQLERRFAQHVGLSPKAYSRVTRFRQVKAALGRIAESSDVHLAYSCGYYDQTHLIREFKAFTGQTPSCYQRSHLVGFFLYNLERTL